MSLIVSGGYLSSRIPNPGPITQIQPFTYEDGVTFAELLAGIKRYIIVTLEPYLLDLTGEVDEKITNLIIAVDAALDAQTELVDQKIADLDALVTDKIADLVTLVNTTLADQTASVDAKIATLEADVAEAIQQVIDSAIEVQDVVVAGILNNPASDSRVVSDKLYVPPLLKSDNSAAAALTYVSVDDYNAVGDGVTDDGDAIIAALAAAGPSSRVRLGAFKRYFTSKTLPLDLHQHLEGAASSFGTGVSARAEIVSTALVGVTMRSYAGMSNLVLRGAADTVVGSTGIKMLNNTSNSLSLDNVSVMQWETGVLLDQVYYAELNRVETRRNAVGFRITSSLNITMIAPQINCQKADNTPGIGIWGTARALTIIGGSIEQFLSGIRVFNSETLNLHGVYFESTLAAANVRGIDSASIINTTINAYGCYVYMPNLTSWMELRGGTGRVLNAHGNTFIAGSASANVPNAAAYRFTVTGHQVDLSGDNWERVDPADTFYTAVDGGTLPVPGVRVVTPVGDDGSGRVPGHVLDGNLPTRPIQRITHSVDGALTIDPRYGEVEVTLGANATSIVLANPGLNGQELVLTFIQPVGGAYTITQPGFFRWNSNTAPAAPTANTRTTVTYKFNATAARWFEQSRSVNMGN